jgi:hypothetical protein
LTIVVASSLPIKSGTSIGAKLLLKTWRRLIVPLLPLVMLLLLVLLLLLLVRVLVLLLLLLLLLVLLLLPENLLAASGLLLSLHTPKPLVNVRPFNVLPCVPRVALVEESACTDAENLLCCFGKIDGMVLPSLPAAPVRPGSREVILHDCLNKCSMEQ